MWNSKPVVAIFGSSQIVDGDKEYEQARTLGRLLARAGLIICNGGYGGAMEATARGASEMKGISIGLTLDAFGARGANPYLTREISNATLFERLAGFVELADAFLALTGGVGTLAEFSIVWNLLQTKQLAPKPFILVGPRWPSIVEHLHENMEIRAKDLKCLHTVATPEEAVEILKDRLGK